MSDLNIIEEKDYITGRASYKELNHEDFIIPTISDDTEDVGFRLFLETQPASSDHAIDDFIQGWQNNRNKNTHGGYSPKEIQALLPSEELEVSTSKKPFLRKYPLSLTLSSFLGGILLTLSAFSYSLNLQPNFLFWFIMFLPLMGITVGTLMILLGVDKENYF